MSDTIIEIKHLSKLFPGEKNSVHPSYALNDICLTVPEGSIYGIIGMSGAGKSTLLRCLVGLETPSSGEVFFKDEPFPYHDSGALRILRRRIGMVFQHFNLFSSRTVEQNIVYPLEISGVPATERKERADELLDLIGLKNKKNRYPSQLSGGEKQRVGIARALAPRPELLLFDEFTSALDSKTSREMLGFLKELHARQGLTLIMITHQLEVIKQICDRVAVLCRGRIVEEGPVKEIFTRPVHEITKQLVHLSANTLPPELLKECAGSRLLRLGFEGHDAKQPIISRLIKQHPVEVNILSGGLDYLQNMTVGHLFVELTGTDSEIAEAVDFLKNRHVICEVIR